MVEPTPPASWLVVRHSSAAAAVEQLRLARVAAIPSFAGSQKGTSPTTPPLMILLDGAVEATDALALGGGLATSTVDGHGARGVDCAVDGAGEAGAADITAIGCPPVHRRRIRINAPRCRPRDPVKRIALARNMYAWLPGCFARRRSCSP